MAARLTDHEGQERERRDRQKNGVNLSQGVECSGSCLCVLKSPAAYRPVRARCKPRYPKLLEAAGRSSESSFSLDAACLFAAPFLLVKGRTSAPLAQARRQPAEEKGPSPLAAPRAGARTAEHTRSGCSAASMSPVSHLSPASGVRPNEDWRHQEQATTHLSQGIIPGIVCHALRDMI